ncbi:hypothetical protein SCLCIDRAFT_24730 [Scleroderma citrinum Foug A]|uniref:Uncharacterized protein n=1 Tax=Scleroderma citrinum Foug A TaxID=1036808 RepID=A0A0C2ZMW6_9AGAM|nr:hypothetical protein SCLCIDRAFT_24730 [Scleroderma citrinum Foug A]
MSPVRATQTERRGARAGYRSASLFLSSPSARFGRVDLGTRRAPTGFVTACTPLIHFAASFILSHLEARTLALLILPILRLPSLHISGCQTQCSPYTPYNLAHGCALRSPNRAIRFPSIGPCAVSL